MSPTQRSLALLRKNGWTVCVVEKWIPGANIRRDAFGFGDLLIFRGVRSATFPNFAQICLVQVTSGSNMAARREKIRKNPLSSLWKEAGGLILLHGWRKAGLRGAKKTWRLSEETL